MASYKVSQENGQRKYGPPLGWRGAPPPRGSEVYVSRIPRNLREDCLIPIFSSIGTIYTLRLMMDFSGSNRGFCFIQYTSVEEANRAIVELDGFELVPEHQIKVCRSVDNRRLFLGQIPKDKTKQEIFDALSSIVSGVVDIILFISASDKRFNKGFCFAEFETHRAAAMARRTLVVNGLRFWNREVRIDWAMPEIFVEDSVMAKVTTIHIRNVLAETSEADLKNIIYNFANREDVVKLRKIRDFAFVNINTREAAERVFEGLKNYKIDGVEIIVSWAKPSNKFHRNKLSSAHHDRRKNKISYTNVDKAESSNNQMTENQTVNQCKSQNGNNQLAVSTSPDLNFKLDCLPSNRIGQPVDINYIQPQELFVDRNNMLDSFNNISSSLFVERTSAIAIDSLLPQYTTHYSISKILQDLATSQGFVLAYDVSVLFAGPSYYHIPHFQATVTFIKDGRLHTFPNIQHGLAVTPEQAKDLAAEAFINAFGWALQ